MQDTARIRSYFRNVLVAATIASLAGNITHALPAVAGSTATAIVLAAVAPLTLLVLVHGLGHLAVTATVTDRAVRPKRSGTVRAVITAVVTVAVAAFAVSFTVLRDLALGVGWSPWLAWLLPVILDVTVIVSTLVLVVVDTPTAAVAEAVEQQPDTASTSDAASVTTTSAPPFDYPLLDPDRHRFALTTTTDIPVIVADDVVDDQPPTTTYAEVDEPVAVADQVADDHQPTADTAAVAVPAAPASLHLVPSDDHRTAAAAVADRGVVKVSTAVIEQVLAGLADGLSQRRVAEVVGVDRSTVSRIKATAAELVAA